MSFDWNEFVSSLPKEEALISSRLRRIIIEAEPLLIEKYNYWVPYYSRNKLICFIWPVSAPNAPTAKNQKDDGTIVSLGFCYGNELSNDQGLLLAEGRKQVYIIRLRSMKELTSIENQITEIIHEAILLDNQKSKSITRKQKS